MPKQFLDLNSLLLRAAGLVALLSIPFKMLPRRVDGILPFNSALTSRYTSFVLGISLLYIANQVARKKRSAYLLAVGGLSLLILVELLHFRNPVQLALYSITLTSIIKDRHDYVVKSDAYTIRRAALISAGILSAVVLFSGAVLSEVSQRDFGGEVSIGTTVDIIARSFVGAPPPAGVELHRGGRRIVDLLHVAGISAAVLIGLSFFQPLKLRRPAPRSHLQEARRIATAYGNSTEDSLKLWPEDKHYFFYQDSFVAYRVTNGVALVLDGVTGKPSDAGRLRPAFLRYANENGWTVAIVHADAEEAEKWQRYDMQQLFIGSEAAVDTQEFTSKTIGDKHFRYVRNKAAKEALRFELWEAPLSDAQIAQLRTVSDAWLATGRREYRFIMGYFDAAYLRQTTVGVLWHGDAVVAYANLLPSYTADGASIDHMRSLPDVSQVAMHYLLLELISDSANRGVAVFNLGLAPLSKLEEQAANSLGDRLMPVIKTLGSRYYSFSGLEQFKGKFRPDWEARYIVYQGGPARLPIIITALNNAIAYK